MNRKDIRQHRRQVRRFQRASGALLGNTICCGGVSVAQCHVLLELERLGAVSLLDLTRALGVSKGAVSRTTDGLVKLGLVSRSTDEVDRRRVSLELTKGGRSTVDKINNEADGYVKQIFKFIPADRHEDVLECFDILVDAAATAEDERCGRVERVMNRRD